MRDDHFLSWWSRGYQLSQVTKSKVLFPGCFRAFCTVSFIGSYGSCSKLFQEYTFCGQVPFKMCPRSGGVAGDSGDGCSPYGEVYYSFSRKEQVLHVTPPPPGRRGGAVMIMRGLRLLKNVWSLLRWWRVRVLLPCINESRFLRDFLPPPPHPPATRQSVNQRRFLCSSRGPALCSAHYMLL